MTRGARDSRTSVFGRKLSAAALSILTVGSVVAFAPGRVSAAGSLSGKALINGATVAGSPSVESTIATSLGLSVTVVSGSTWASMTAADFAKYRVLIIGDPSCGVLAPSVTTSRAAWTSAVMATAGGNTAVGNRVVWGADPVHRRAGHPSIDKGINDGIAFAAALAPVSGHATGVYFTASCDAQTGDNPALVDTLNRLSVGTTRPWTEEAEPACGVTVAFVATAPQFGDITASDLSGLPCSVRESFPTYETDWVPLAIATDTSNAATCGADVVTNATRCGEAFFLAAGPGLIAMSPDIALATSSPIETVHTITATVSDGPGGPPLIGQPVDFTVSGANAGASGSCVPANCQSNGNGKVTFLYGVTRPGDDTIVVTIVCVGTILTATTSVSRPDNSARIVVSPLTGTNPTFTTHTITATVTDSQGVPLSGQLVSFTVAGANAGASGTCDPASCLSDASGQVSFTYTGAHSGTDTISAGVMAAGVTRTASATKTWTATPPAITLKLPTGKNPINTTHTVTATVTNGPGGPPMVGKLVKFTVVGANTGVTGSCVPADCKTNSAGMVQFTYVGTHVGNDRITSSITLGGVTLIATATKKWTIPATNTPRIFQVEFRSCTNLHVGYNLFPAGTVVRWNVRQNGAVVATKRFTALGGGKAHHFLTQPLGVTLRSSPDGLATFQWALNGNNFSFTMARKPGC